MSQNPIAQNPSFYHAREILSDGLPAAIQQVRQWCTVAHRHDFIEFVLVMEGTALHHVEGKTFELAPGDFFVIERGQEHAYSKTRELQIINVIIRAPVMSCIRKDLKKLCGYQRVFSERGGFIQPRRLSATELRELSGYALQIGREARSQQDGRNLIIKSLLRLLLAGACRCANAPLPRHQIRTTIDRLLDYLDANFHRAISLPELELEMCSTARSLQRHFKAETGQSITEYLMHIRIMNAQRLLCETDYKAEEIATRCGFSDCAYFNRQFAKITGLPPGQYRRKIRTERGLEQ